MISNDRQSFERSTGELFSSTFSRAKIHDKSTAGTEKPLFSCAREIYPRLA